MDRLLLALDVGGTKISAATLLAGEHIWRRHARRATPTGGDASSDLEIIQTLAEMVLEGARPHAVGVSFGGPVDYQRGIVRLSHHVPGWRDLPLAAHLAAALGVPVVVDNDANAAALGEHRFGAGQDVSSLLYVTISTGVGGGWILAGDVWRGLGSMAGEIGHTQIDPAGPLCLCGKRGCVERLASGPYLAEDAREWLAHSRPADSVLWRLIDGDLTRLSGEIVARAAAAGDPKASNLIQRSGHSLGVGLGNAINLMAPARVLLGGGVTKSGRRWWDAARSAARQIVLPELTVDIRPAALGDDAPLWGAVALAHDALEATE